MAAAALEVNGLGNAEKGNGGRTASAVIASTGFASRFHSLFHQASSRSAQLVKLARKRSSPRSTKNAATRMSAPITIHLSTLARLSQNSVKGGSLLACRSGSLPASSSSGSSGPLGPCFPFPLPPPPSMGSSFSPPAFFSSPPVRSFFLPSFDLAPALSPFRRLSGVSLDTV